MAGIIVPRVAGRAPAVGFSAGDSHTKVKVHDLDSDIPKGLPKPPLWKLYVMPVRQVRETKGGIFLPNESIDVQQWTHMLYKIAAVGPQVYRGKAYESYQIDEDEIPKVGDLWLVSPKQPTRFGFAGISIIVINDDQLLGRVDSKQVSKLSFLGIELN